MLYAILAKNAFVSREAPGRESTFRPVGRLDVATNARQVLFNLGGQPTRSHMRQGMLPGALTQEICLMDSSRIQRQIERTDIVSCSSHSTYLECKRCQARVRTRSRH
jgi:hypothetical protein